MKKQITQRRQTVLLTSIAIVFLLSACHSTFAQKGIGAKYGARDPRICADKQQPRTGAPSAAQATEYVTCGAEVVYAEDLYFVEEIQVFGNSFQKQH